MRSSDRFALLVLAGALSACEAIPSAAPRPRPVEIATPGGGDDRGDDLGDLDGMPRPAMPGPTIIASPICNSSGCDFHCDDDLVKCGVECVASDALPSPTENACVIAEAFGVFVDARALAGGDGSQERPFASLKVAISAAAARKKRVYACEGLYREAVELAPGVSMFGGFSCANGWAIGPGRAKIESPTSPAMRAVDIVQKTKVSDFDVFSADARAPSETSVALLAIHSPGLVIERSTIRAGRGANGAIAVETAPLTQSGGANGVSGTGDGSDDQWCYFDRGSVERCNARAKFGLGGVSRCISSAGVPTSDALNGGGGGSGGVGSQQLIPCTDHDECSHVFIPEAPGLPIATTSASAQGGYANFDETFLAAAGANGARGAQGVSSDRRLGTFSIASPIGYIADNAGVAGRPGAPGQGGGGGRGLRYRGDSRAFPQYGPRGSGGGAGGCAGLGGAAGTAGGASIALVAFGSPLTIASSWVESSTGGDGGRGAFGSFGTDGGFGGDAFAADLTNRGAAGGTGGAGGWGGSGGGGPSFAIAHQGAAPSIISSTLVVGGGGRGVEAIVARDDRGTIAASVSGASAPLFLFATAGK